MNQVHRRLCKRSSTKTSQTTPAAGANVDGEQRPSNLHGLNAHPPVRHSKLDEKGVGTAVGADGCEKCELIHAPNHSRTGGRSVGDYRQAYDGAVLIGTICPVGTRTRVVEAHSLITVRTRA